MYASQVHVEALDTGRPSYTASTRPSADQVTQYLDETGAILDGILRQRGYLLPVPTTATASLKTLENFNAIGAWALVEQAAPTSKDQGKAAAAMWDSAQKMLLDGVIELDAPIDENTSLPRSNLADPFSSSATPFFSRAMDF